MKRLVTADVDIARILEHVGKFLKKRTDVFKDIGLIHAHDLLIHRAVVLVTELLGAVFNQLTGMTHALTLGNELDCRFVRILHEISDLLMGVAGPLVAAAGNVLSGMVQPRSSTK